MKVLLVNSLYSPHFVGGAERSVQALAEGLVAAGHRIAVVSTAGQPDDTHGEVNGVAVHYLAHRNRYWTYTDRRVGRLEKLAWHTRDTYDRSTAGRVAAVVGREAPDVVHTNNLVGMSVAVWDAVAARGVPIVHTLRDYYLMCPSSTMFRRGRSCDRACAGCSVFGLRRRAASRRVAAVAGVSAFILEKHRRAGYFPAAMRAEAIRTGHDPKPCAAAPRGPSPGGPVIVGFLGCLSPNKGVEMLLTAVDRLPRDGVVCRVGGSGKPAYEAELRRRFARPNVEFVGQTPAAEFLRSLDVLVVASLWEEPLARVIIEAISHGTPVVTSPRGGSPEVVRHGVNGLVCDDDSADAMARALGGLVGDRDRLAALRRSTAAHPEVNTVRMMTERYVALYEAVAAAGPAPATRRTFVGTAAAAR